MAKLFLIIYFIFIIVLGQDIIFGTNMYYVVLRFVFCTTFWHFLRSTFLAIFLDFSQKWQRLTIQLGFHIIVQQHIFFTYIVQTFIKRW